MGVGGWGGGNLLRGMMNLDISKWWFLSYVRLPCVSLNASHVCVGNGKHGVRTSQCIICVCCIFVFCLVFSFWCGFVFCIFVVVIVLGCVLVVCMCVGHCCGHYRCIYNDVFF